MTDRSPARQHNTARDQGTVFAVQDGDLHIHQRNAAYFIDELTFGEVTPSGDEQPSRLLNAGNRVVSFTGRREEVAELTAWRDGAAAVAVRLVHGGAGQGKTRLAHRLAELSQRSGWVVARARHSRDVAVRPIEIPSESGPPVSRRLLLLVDYAERWPVSDLLALFHDQRLHDGTSLRVLLLARPLDNWWHALIHPLRESLGIGADSVELAPLGADRMGSLEAFQVARDCFARALAVPVPTTSAQRVEGSVLTIHMAALAHVLAARDGDRAPTDPSDLSAYLLSRERSHWQGMYDNRRIGSPPQLLGRAVYVATLTRALDYPAAAQALQSAALAESRAAAGPILDDHARCYPPPPDSETLLEPLYPDRLAEDFVALQTPGHGVAGFRPDPWAGHVLKDLLRAGVASADTVLPLLLEATSRWPHLVDRHLVPLLREQPSLAIEGGTPALSAIAAARHIPLDVLESIERLLPADPPGDLCAGIAAVTERLVADLARNVVDAVQGVRILRKLGSRLYRSGRVAEGLAMLTQSVEATRRLVAADRAAHAGRLEFALRLLGGAHVQARNWAKAADALGEAVELWTSDRLDASLPATAIADCLSDLSLALWRTGKGPEALAVRQDAIAQLRPLAADRPRHRLALIRALVQQAEHLRRGKRAQASLDALDEAFELLGAAAGTEGLEKTLASALLGRARTLMALRRSQEALQAAAGAVQVLRSLADLDISYDQDLGRALEVEALNLAALNRWAEATRAQANAVTIHRRLARINPERFGLGCVAAQIAFARHCRDGNRQRREALGALSEAVHLLRSGIFDSAAQERWLRSAQSVAADLLIPAPGHGRPRPSPRPDEPAQQPDQRSATPPDVEDAIRRLGGSPANIDPQSARTVFEWLYTPDLTAAALLAMNPGREWLDEVFADLDLRKARKILWYLIGDPALVSTPTMLALTSAQLRRQRPYSVAQMLRLTTPNVAAMIFIVGNWHEREITEILNFLELPYSTLILRALEGR